MGLITWAFDFEISNIEHFEIGQFDSIKMLRELWQPLEKQWKQAEIIALIFPVQIGTLIGFMKTFKFMSTLKIIIPHNESRRKYSHYKCDDGFRKHVIYYNV